MKIKKFLFYITSGFVLSLVILILTVAFSSPAPIIRATVTDDLTLPRIKVNGVLLHSEAYGNPKNPLLVVLHGGPGSDYRTLLPLKELADQYFVVFYDQRGSGLSQRVDKSELTIEAYREELRGVIEHYQNGRPIYLLGHSWGAMLGASFLGNYGELIDKAILIEPGFLNSEILIEVMKRTNGFMPRTPSLQMTWNILRNLIRSLRIHGPDDHAQKDFITESLMNSSSTESPTALYFCGADTKNGKLEHWRVGADSMQLLAELNAPNKAANFDLTQGLDKFSKPVLLMAGGCNTIIGKDIQSKHLALFTNAKLEVISDAGHNMIGEKPTESISVLRRFLKE